MTTYKIVRFFRDSYRRDIVATGLSLEEAQAITTDPETSSRTATSQTARLRTERYGPWFEGYQEE